ncbi:MAG: GTP cyclohydrolase II [Deltaproteobacteria bacterium]|nr:MAG: GTP cyclohydrolase II [Deltaproteobacteria bacterium]
MSAQPLLADIGPEFTGQPGEVIDLADGLRVEIFARAQLPTRNGSFEMVAFRNTKDSLDHVALVRGDVAGREAVPVRLHSECLTGDVFGSLKCDCRDQLEAGIDAVATRDFGVVLYLRQEGRGIGLANKIKAYSLQDRGMDTVEANLHLGFDDDLREYDVAAGMIHLLGIRSVELYTNNPNKVAGLRSHGVAVATRAPIQCDPNPHNRFYLVTKRRKSGHLLDL